MLVLLLQCALLLTTTASAASVFDYEQTTSDLDVPIGTLKVAVTDRTETFVTQSATTSSLFQCVERTQPCVSSDECCDTAPFCLEGVCRRCARNNQNCVVDDDCCGSRVCDTTSGLCQQEPTSVVIVEQVDARSEAPAVLEEVVFSDTKRSWPETVGMTGDSAEDLILSENPNLRVEIVFEDMFLTADYWEDRVRVVVDNQGIVVQSPQIG
jgi:hypothetical protein